MRDRVRQLRVTILADNLAAGGEGVLAEHGLSLLVEADGQSLLFDVGQSGIVLGNAARLGLDLTRAHSVVLSHGHYDHTGALPLLLAALGPKEIIAHPALFQGKYARRRRAKPRPIGFPGGRDALAERGAALNLDAEPRALLPGVMTSGEIARTTDFETIPAYFAVRAGRGMRKDEFADEQALAIRTRKGLVVLVGCSHRGVVNALRHAAALTGEERIHAVIGGTHLGPASDEQVERTIEEFENLGVERVVACHCTGFRAAARLAEALGDRFDPGGVGYQFKA